MAAEAEQTVQTYDDTAAEIPSETQAPMVRPRGDRGEQRPPDVALIGATAPVALSHVIREGAAIAGPRRRTGQAFGGHGMIRRVLVPGLETSQPTNGPMRLLHGAP
jgi:hypothetical protein